MKKALTEKQIERVQLKIKRLKAALAEDKRQWGGFYHDGRGIRYLLPAEFIKIKEYKAGLRYINWFNKNFPEDIGFPIFLFECCFILFKGGKPKEAEMMAEQTFFSNTYIIDKFLAKDLLDFNKSELSNWQQKELAEILPYAKTDNEFGDFAAWLESVMQKRSFLDKANEFIDLQKQLKNEDSVSKRTEIVNRLNQLTNM